MIDAPQKVTHFSGATERLVAQTVEIQALELADLNERRKAREAHAQGVA